MSLTPTTPHEVRGGSDRLDSNGGNDRNSAASYIDTASAIAAATPEQPSTFPFVAEALSGGTGNDLLVGRLASRPGRGSGHL